ncbi:hypothetical protein RCL1_005642 [Eukaryota sp. TZLM3-RCL]
MVKTVFVGNIAFEASEDEVKQIFSSAGDVIKFNLVRDHETGKPKGYGFVEYHNEASALLAMRTLNGRELRGRNLRVSYADADKPDEVTVKADGTVTSAETLNKEKVTDMLSHLKELAVSDRNLFKSYLQENPKLAYAIITGLYSQGLIRQLIPELQEFLSRVQLPVIADQQPPETPSFAPPQAQHPVHQLPHHLLIQQQPQQATAPPQLPVLSHLPPDQYHDIVQRLLAATPEQIQQMTEQQRQLHAQLQAFHGARPV